MSGPAPRRAPGFRAALAAIALNTFREAARDRILYLFLVFSLLVIAASRYVSLLTVGSETKIVKDLGLSAISIFGLLTSVFVGVSLVFKEIERRTVFTLLANPVRRWQFVAGKYLGLMLVLSANLVLMSAALAAVVAWRGESPAPLVPAEALILVELAVVTAFALLFSSFTNPILSAVGTLAVYVAGHLSWSFELLRKRMPGTGGQALCGALRAVVPNLDRLDVKAEAVHGLELPHGYAAAGAAYGILYALAILALACAVFERRDFS